MIYWGKYLRLIIQTDMNKNSKNTLYNDKLFFITSMYFKQTCILNPEMVIAYLLSNTYSIMEVLNSSVFI